MLLGRHTEHINQISLPSHGNVLAFVCPSPTTAHHSPYEGWVAAAVEASHGATWHHMIWLGCMEGLRQESAHQAASDLHRRTTLNMVVFSCGQVAPAPALQPNERLLGNNE